MTTDNHRKVYTNSRGERVMRVTEVIKIMAKDQLVTWANMLGFKHISYRQELERTSNIGSLVHDVLEKYSNKRVLADIDFNAFNVQDYGDRLEVRNALDSFFKWLEAMKDHRTFNVKFTELVVVGETLGGTIDCGIEGWKNPDKVIFVDYKTSKGFYLTQFLQLAAYAMIYEEVYGKDTVEGIMVVILDKKHGDKGQARFIGAKDLDIFINCFKFMFNLAVSTKMLDSQLLDITQRID